MGGLGGIVIIDETAFATSGEQSPHVQLMNFVLTLMLIATFLKVTLCHTGSILGHHVAVKLCL